MNNPLKILYEDQYIIAINKPSGLLVHRSEIDRHETTFAVQRLRDQIDQFVFPVHRLDKQTSGVLLFAKTKPALSGLSAQFETHQVEKYYKALVRGHAPTSMTIEHPVKSRQDKYNKRSQQAPKAGITVLRSIQYFEIAKKIETYPHSRFTLVELQPLTGRRHQLRYHMKHISHPIIGDSSYGRGAFNRYFRDHYHCNRLLLVSDRLCFRHPITDESLDIVASLGDDFTNAINQIETESL